MLITLVILPFDDDLSAQIYAARMLMITFFAGATVLAFLAISRLTSNDWIALTVTLLAFSSTYWLYYNDVISTEIAPDTFGVLLVFHGMVIFAQEGRFRQLLIKACLALLLGWHVYALLLVFITLGLIKVITRVWVAQNVSLHPGHWRRRQLSMVMTAAIATIRSRYMRLGVATLLFGMLVLSFNFGVEYSVMHSEMEFTELPSYRSMIKRIGQNEHYNVIKADVLSWSPYLERQFHRLGWMSLPYSPLSYLERPDVFSESPPVQLWAVITGVAAVAVCLAGLAFVRHKILLATLILSGFVWAIVMRHHSAIHPFESLAYTGISLTFFLLVLLGLYNLWGNRGVVGLSMIALLIFGLSSFQMSRVGHDAQAAQLQYDIVADFEVIRRITDIAEGKTVAITQDVTNRSYSRTYGDDWYYLYGGTVLITDQGDKLRFSDFFLLAERELSPALLTPNNQIGFC